jgi:hypothetical protein
MATRRKRKKSQTDLAPKAVKGKEADRVKGGDKTSEAQMLANVLRMLSDTQKTIIGNIR